MKKVLKSMLMGYLGLLFVSTFITGLLTKIDLIVKWIERQTEDPSYEGKEGLYKVANEEGLGVINLL